MSERRRSYASCSSTVITTQYVEAYQSPVELFLLTEYPKGDVMSNILGEPMADLTARFYIACVIQIVSHLHSKRIVCRDIRPEVFVVGDNGAGLATRPDIAQSSV